MNIRVPDQIRGNPLSELLADFIREYHQLSRTGQIYGLMIVDQDAKVLAVNPFFDNHLNYWDVGAIGSALYGVSKQGKDFFGSETLERASIIFDDKQFFTRFIDKITLKNNQTRELIMIMIGDRQLNIGLAVLKMKKYAPLIKQQLLNDTNAQETMKMAESQFYMQINEIKKELFNL